MIRMKNYYKINKFKINRNRKRIVYNYKKIRLFKMIKKIKMRMWRNKMNSNNLIKINCNPKKIELRPCKSL